MKILFPATAVLALAFSLLACKNKQTKSAEIDPFFPALSIIRDQVARVDTSLYPIRKLVFVDSARTDTIHIRREDFKSVAADFLSLPDLSEPKYRERYSESSTYDTTLKRVILILEPRKPEEEVIQRQEVLIKPDASGDRVTSIHIDYLFNSRDSLVEKRLFWQFDKSFQVAITKRLPGQAQTTTTYKVVWNEEP